jgi:hypothetical protein
MVDNSRRNMRLANTRWFRLINYRDFIVYMADLNSLPQIVDRLLQYNDPIGLHFKKSKIKTMEGYISHVSRLTHLTTLHIPCPESSTIQNSTWSKFSVLTNLREQAIGCPPHALVPFVNLNELSLANDQDAILMASTMKKMSNLERINIGTGCAASLYVYSLVPCPARVTSLQTHGKADHRHATKFYNLQSLDYKGSLWNIPLQLSFDTFTALERLNIEQRSKLSFTALPTRLTSLSIQAEHMKPQSVEALARLHNLRALTVNLFRESDDHLTWLSGLTSLAQLSFWPIYYGGDQVEWIEGTFFDYIKSSKLTELVMNVQKQMSLDRITRLTSLEEVIFHEDQGQMNFDYSFVSHLTRLTNFTLYYYDYTPSLSALTALEHLRCLDVISAISSCPVLFPMISLATLTSLQSVKFDNCTRDTWESLAALKHLTSLRVMEKLLDSNGDYQFLNDLPLRELECHTDDAAADNFYGALSRLTDLQALTVRALSAEQVAGLSSLHHLTRLHLYQCHVGVNGENFTRLTSVQYLSLAGCRPTALNSATIERQMPNLVAFANNHTVQ